MGNENSKANFRKSFIQLLAKTQPVDINDNDFWNQFWNECDTTVQDVFNLIGTEEIKTLREESPNNIATFCYKAVEKLSQLSESLKFTGRDKDIALNCVRILTRLLPFLFEDKDWRSFFWSSVPSQPDPSGEQVENVPLAYTLMSSLTDLLFFPDFTVCAVKSTQGEGQDDSANSKVIDSCEYIWESGVGFSSRVYRSPHFDRNRTELLKLLLTCFSETMYVESFDSSSLHDNLWLHYFTGTENRHALPLFTSLLNTVFSYDPVGYGVPYNHLVFADTREALMEVALQILCVTLESLEESKPTMKRSDSLPVGAEEGLTKTRMTLVHSTSTDSDITREARCSDNLFLHYMSRIHRDEDFAFLLNGLIRLLNNPLAQTYLPGSTKRVRCHQELLILLWRMCDINRRFLFYLLKSSHILEVLVPILFYLNDSRSDQSKIGLVHMGVFILLMLSGERNFGVRLNKPYDNRVSMDIPVFTGTHADLLIIVFHKVITTGHHLLQPLFDCLLTVIVNISPYLKSLSMVTANKLLHLLEAFTSPWFLLFSSTNHHLVFFLLEILNNIVQYQFDGNSNLIYCIIRKRLVFFNLVNFKTDQDSIDTALRQKTKTSGSPSRQATGPARHRLTKEASTASGLNEAVDPASIVKTSLKDTPSLANMTSDYRRNAVSDELHTGGSPNAVVVNCGSGSGGGVILVSQEDAQPEPAAAQQHNTSPVGAGSAHQTPRTPWRASPKWVQQWKQKLPLQTIMRLLQVLVPQVEKLCIEKGLTDESEILKFLQRGTLVGLLPVPHPILIRKYQANVGTNMWFRTYMWGVIYLRNIQPPIWYDTNVRLFEIQKVSDN